MKYEDCPICRRGEARYSVKGCDGKERFVCSICFETMMRETDFIRRHDENGRLEATPEE